MSKEIESTIKATTKWMDFKDWIAVGPSVDVAPNAVKHSAEVGGGALTSGNFRVANAYVY